jgi:1-hydroxycarotenoid 3,4-desaturase
MTVKRVVVVGAGIGGIAAAVDLAARGCDVTVCERGASPGGKLRCVAVAGASIDAGPTVLTMRWVFEELAAAAGASLDQLLSMRQLKTFARHAWSEGETLDLHADLDESADAIGRFAGKHDARGYRTFCADAQRTYRTLERPFLRAPRATPLQLAADAGLGGLMDLWRIKPFVSMWRSLGSYFCDARLRQLFGRYATYCGSSPFLAPATLSLIAHVERDGVWRVDGNLWQLARAFEQLATERGARFRYRCDVAEVIVRAGRAAGVRIKDGESIEADAVVVNADVAALGDGLLGAKAAAAVPRVLPRHRSLSALTWLFHASTRGFPLLHHTVFFSRDYQAEFADLLRERRVPRSPTVYICAQDRGDANHTPPKGAERLLCIVNAPATGDTQSFSTDETAAMEQAMRATLGRCGLQLVDPPGAKRITTPQGFAQLFPGTGGALYGMASHGWRASFARPGVRSRIPGLFVAGGSAHPGPGLPMAALSGRAAAAAVLGH